MSNEGAGIKILLGCLDEQRAGWVHHDRERFFGHVEVVHDLTDYPWPWASNSADRIEARHVLEHLGNTVRFFDECHRILKPGGRLLVTVPHYEGENAWKDPTHVRAFHPETFSYFDPESGMGQTFGRFYTRLFWRLEYVVEDGVEIEARLEVRK